MSGSNISASNSSGQTKSNGAETSFNSHSTSCSSTGDTWLSRYNRDGFHFPVRVISEDRAFQHRQELERIEAEHGESGQAKLAIGHANSLIPFADELTRSPAVLNPVKQILGPDIMVWNASFFIKNAHTEDFISWHQDLTYWGLNDSHEVTAWIALTKSNIASGCVKFVPGSHTSSIVEHRDTFDENNLLSRGQELAVDVDENDAVNVELKPGEMSLHHGQVFHGSNKNRSSDRRIGLAIRYITPNMKQTSDEKTDVKLVCGEDNYANFNLRDKPKATLHEDDIAAVKRNIAVLDNILYANTTKPER